MANFDDDIKIVLQSFMESINNDAMTNNLEITEKLAALYADDNFFDKIEYAQNQFDMIISNIINVPLQKNVYIVKHIVSGLYEHFFRVLIEKTEGSMCSYDKISFIKQKTLRALQTKTNLSLYDNYVNCDSVKEEKERQAYWSPTTIPDTDTAMKLFWNWYLLRSDNA